MQGMRPREPRQKVVIQAGMRTEGTRANICIRDISSGGLLIQTASPPPRGTYVEIFMGCHTIVGRVVWRKDRRFGIQTRERLNVTAVIKGRGLRASSPEIVMADPPFVARSNPRAGTAETLAERAERARRMSAAFQFASIAAGGVAGALLIVSAVQSTLARPLETISSSLAQ